MKLADSICDECHTMDASTKIKLSNQKRVLEALQENFYVVSKACAMAGIDRHTYYNWMEDDPKFVEKAEKVERDLFSAIEDKLKEEAIRRQPWAIRFFLARRHPKYKSKVELSQAPDFTLDSDDEFGP